MTQLELFNETRDVCNMIFDSIKIIKHSHMITEVITDSNIRRFYCWETCVAFLTADNGYLYLRTDVPQLSNDVKETHDFIAHYHKDNINTVEEL